MHDNIYTLAMRQERDSRTLSSQAAVHLPWRIPQRAERALSEVRTLLSRLQVAKAFPHILLWEHWMSEKVLLVDTWESRKVAAQSYARWISKESMRL